MHRFFLAVYTFFGRVSDDGISAYGIKVGLRKPQPRFLSKSLGNAIDEPKDYELLMQTPALSGPSTFEQTLSSHHQIAFELSYPTFPFRSAISLGRGTHLRP